MLISRSWLLGNKSCKELSMCGRTGKTTRLSWRRADEVLPWPGMYEAASDVVTGLTRRIYWLTQKRVLSIPTSNTYTSKLLYRLIKMKNPENSENLQVRRQYRQAIKFRLIWTSRCEIEWRWATKPQYNHYQAFYSAMDVDVAWITRRCWWQCRRWEQHSIFQIPLNRELHTTIATPGPLLHFQAGLSLFEFNMSDDDLYFNDETSRTMSSDVLFGAQTDDFDFDSEMDPPDPPNTAHQRYNSHIIRILKFILYSGSSLESRMRLFGGPQLPLAKSKPGLLPANNRGVRPSESSVKERSGYLNYDSWRFQFYFVAEYPT